MAKNRVFSWEYDCAAIVGDGVISFDFGEGLLLLFSCRLFAQNVGSTKYVALRYTLLTIATLATNPFASAID